ncbi:hypothetical protein [Mesorhizobium denitrificans]|uniref:hypothetical protein n=1 Tax=Mesorhizobium denitrificans TaxID=2294114 RepID=UPI0011C05E0C|nr:hypothetical protein [Mesorhizobium denitrificans]
MAIRTTFVFLEVAAATRQQNIVAADLLEGHAEIVDDFEPAEIGTAMYESYVRIAKRMMDEDSENLWPSKI